MSFLYLHISDSLLSYYYFKQRVCVCLRERKREHKKCSTCVLLKFFFFLMSRWIFSVLSPWCQVASGVCVCLNRQDSQNKLYFEDWESSYCRVYIQITTEHRVCRPPYLLFECQDVIHVSEQSTVWPLLRGTVLFPAAPPCNTMMQMEENTFADHQCVFLVLFIFFGQMEPSMPLHTNYLCEWLAVRLKERGTRTFGG